MAPIYGLAILLIVFAFGEIVAQKTKALLSTTLVIATILLIAFWCGLDPDIFKIAAVDGIAMNLIGILILSMGTMMDFPELKRQWKTVVISLICVISGVVMIIFLGSLFIPREMAIAGSPIFAGSNVATIIMTKALSEKGLESLGTFVILMLVTQNFIGIPLSSILLRKEAQAFINNKELMMQYSKIAEKDNVTKKRKLLELPALFSKPSAILAKLALVACLAFYVSKLTGGKIHYFVIVLLMGVIFSEIGFLEKNIFPKTESSAFIIFSTTIIIFGNLAKTTPSMVLSMIFPLCVCLLIGTLGVVIAGIIFGKILKVNVFLAITLGLTCMYGFPTTMLMSKEVAVAIGKNEQEQESILNYLMPKMITAGFVTVTISSVVIAGFVVNLL